MGAVPPLQMERGLGGEAIALLRKRSEPRTSLLGAGGRGLPGEGLPQIRTTKSEISETKRQSFLPQYCILYTAYLRLLFMFFAFILS